MADQPDSEKTGGLARLKAGASAKYTGYRDTHPWLAHTVSAFDLLKRNNGNQYAAAITYFSFLALFPLLLLAVSITGFVLSSHHHLENEFFAHITAKVPGEFGVTLSKALHQAIDARTGVGIVGIVGVALAGGTWIANLREAIDGVWGKPPEKKNFVMARLVNLGVLAGLGVGLLASLGLTAIGTSLTDQILSALSLDSLPGAHAVLKVLGILIAAAADSIIFWWVLVRLPAIPVPRAIAIKGAILASVGFEILKIVGTYTIAHNAHSPTLGPFASLLAVLIWIQLVARYMLFACAWTATLTAEHDAEQLVIPFVGEEPESSSAADAVERPAQPSPAAVGATLVGAGAVAGALATWAATRQRVDRD